MFIGEFVENSLTFLTGGHDSGHAQPGEVLGNCCGGFIDDVREVVYGKFTTVSKCQDDANSSGVREESENFDGKFDVLAIRVHSAHFLICIHTQIIAQLPLLWLGMV